MKFIVIPFLCALLLNSFAYAQDDLTAIDGKVWINLTPERETEIRNLLSSAVNEISKFPFKMPERIGGTGTYAVLSVMKLLKLDDAKTTSDYQVFIEQDVRSENRIRVHILPSFRLGIVNGTEIFIAASYLNGTLDQQQVYIGGYSTPSPRR